MKFNYHPAAAGLVILFLLVHFSPNPVLAISRLVITKTDHVQVTASIGRNRVTITGFGPPHCVIELSSPQVYASVYSDPSGYFIFDRTILPVNPGELCLSAIDDSNRRSNPICIPPPPSENYQTDIGPILLSPTLTLDQSQIKPGSTTVASGQSIPNSSVDIYLYQVNSEASVFPQPVEAFSLPKFTVTSDESGNYSFNLPTAYSSNYRLYSNVNYQDNPSPKSNTLTYHLPSLLWLFWQQNSWLVITLGIFIITLTFFFYLIYVYYLAKPEKRYLPALFSYPLAKPTCPSGTLP
jgi:hypothetical protein